MESTAFSSPIYSSDVHTVTRDGREFILVGTAHVSRQSVELVRQVIEQEQPDCVAVELDSQRFQALAKKQHWQNLDIKAVIRQKQLSTLFINLLLSAYQRKLGEKLGVMPGTELLEATRVAEEHNIPVSLCDRDIRITLRRTWNSMSFWDKMKLLAVALAGIFEKPELTEEQLAEIRRKDVLTELIDEIGKMMPTIKTVLIDERDTYLAEKIRQCSGDRVVAVVGAGHVNGIVQRLQNHHPVDLSEIEQIPPVSPVWKWVGWGIPALIIGALIYIGLTKGAAVAGDNALFWILANGIPSSLGAILALAHPLTVAAAFLAAPITSLTPVIGAGYVTAFVQFYAQPPLVKEFQSIGSDITVPKRWWQNRLLRILLVFMFTTLGSVIGTWVGGYRIISNLF
ncbi:MAG: TraB/GumN family protein [Calditrichaeota bacterium]|nr:MAG: TraB/GumN family protein [Calditrichota bacterium]